MLGGVLTNGIAREGPLETIFIGIFPFLAAMVVAATICPAFQSPVLILPKLAR
jgi:hypothetical protein